MKKMRIDESASVCVMVLLTDKTPASVVDQIL
jgi:hypothetical protein